MDNDIHRKLLESMNIANNFMVFESPLEAINYLKQSPEITKSSELNNLIMLDLTMPVIDAWYFIELFKIACTNSITREKIIIISEIFTKKDIEQIKSERLINCFIKKPLTYDKISNCFKNFSMFPLYTSNISEL